MSLRNKPPRVVTSAFKTWMGFDAQRVQGFGLFDFRQISGCKVQLSKDINQGV